jgi:hypothetical protein
LVGDEVLARAVADGFKTARAFKKVFGSRAPDIATLEKIYRGEEVELSSLAKVDVCLRVPNRQFRTYSALSESLGIDSQSIQQARTLLGAFRYYRSDGFGDLVSGGLIFFEYCGLFRFMNFIKRKNFDKFFDAYRSIGDDDVSPFQVARKSVDPDHQGYYFCQADRVYVVGADTSYLRVVSGSISGDLDRKYLRAIVLARDSGAVFAAKTLLVHESNDRFNRDFGLTEFCSAMSALQVQDTIIRL